MGCYRRTLAFLERIGAGGKVHRQASLRVDLAHPRLGAGVIDCPPWPSPLHLAGGLLRYRLLSRGERMRALRAGMVLMAMRRRHDPRLADCTVDASCWSALGQSTHARASFWNPVAVATLQRGARARGRRSLRRGAGAGVLSLAARIRSSSSRVSASAISTPTTRGASSSVAAGACGFTPRRRRSTCTTGARAGRRPARRPPAPRRRLRRGRAARGAGALPAARPACAAGVRAARRARDVADREHHLWFDRPVLDGDFLGLLGTTTQWVFNRTRLLGEDGPGTVRERRHQRRARRRRVGHRPRRRPRCWPTSGAVLPAARARTRSSGPSS